VSGGGYGGPETARRALNIASPARNAATLTQCNWCLASATFFNHIREAVRLCRWRAAVKRSVRIATRSRLTRYSVKTPFPTFQVRCLMREWIIIRLQYGKRISHE
jgi:hypothetical protein